VLCLGLISAAYTENWYLFPRLFFYFINIIFVSVFNIVLPIKRYPLTSTRSPTANRTALLVIVLLLPLPGVLQVTVNYLSGLHHCFSKLIYVDGWVLAVCMIFCLVEHQIYGKPCSSTEHQLKRREMS